MEHRGRAEEPDRQGGGGSGDAWDEAFVAFHERFAPFFYRREVRERSARYLRGLLGSVERTNGWQVAEAVGEPDPQGMQRLLRMARWDADAVRDELIRFVAEHFGDADGLFVVDETGFLKKGAKSVGCSVSTPGRPARPRTARWACS